MKPGLYARAAGRIALIALTLLTAPNGAMGAGLASVYDFGTQPDDGATPFSGLVRSADGRYYGTTSQGGQFDQGTVFRFDSDGSYWPLYQFGSQSGDGSGSGAGLVKAGDGNFYGLTDDGGSAGRGSLFRLTAAGEFSTLVSFGTTAGAGANEFNDATLVVGNDGRLYGTTDVGGAHDAGTVFVMSLDGQFSTLYEFGTQNSDGSNPSGGLTLGSDGYFYGTTANGGQYGGGTIFRISATGALNTLYAFGGKSNEGRNPYAPLTLGSDGSFFGTTQRGGLSAGYGTVFHLLHSGRLRTLYRFGSQPNDADGAAPGTLVLGGDGNFYGTTAIGGYVPTGYIGNGTVFRITPSGQLTVLHLFGSASGDGANPGPRLGFDAQGALYGTTNSYGAYGQGTIFRQEAPLGAPPQVSAVFAPNQVKVHTATTLSWTSDATSCVANGGSGGLLAASGSLSFTPNTLGRYTFVLSCTGPGGVTTVTANLRATAS